MKKTIVITIFLVFAFAKAYPQQSSSAQQVPLSIEETIDAFFIAFHDKNIHSIEKLMMPEATLMSIAIKNDTSKITKEKMEDFLTSLSAIPEQVTFKEEIHSIKVSENAHIATATTGYTFTVNGKKSHSGTNIFVLFKHDGVWKIASIADSRIY